MAHDAPLYRPLAVASCAAFTAAFVGPLYALKRTRIGHAKARDERGRPYDRDHPTVIKTRLASTSLAMPICSLGVWALGRHCGVISVHASPWDQLKLTLRLVGLTVPASPLAALNLLALPAALTATLFAGPLYTAFLDSSLPGMRHFSFKRDVRDVICSWQGFRNYLAAPITEEYVFRACIIAASALAAETPVQLIFLSPLYFGLAHVHHAYEFYVAHGRTRRAAQQGAISSAVQFSYTYLMGVFGSFLFLRSGSIIPPVVAHIVCNCLGLPQLPAALRNHPQSRMSIWATYVAGIAGFVRGLSVLTVPSYFGGSVYWR